MQHRLSQSLLSFLRILVVGYSLGFFYHFLGLFFEEGLSVIITINSIFAGLCLLLLPHLRHMALTGNPFLKKQYLPALAIIILSLILSALTRRLWTSDVAILDRPPSPNLDLITFVTILWVPLIEEILFRGVIGEYLKLKKSTWSMYSSGIIFALAHSAPTIDPLHLPAPPLGPFFLGMLCEFAYRKTGSLWTAIFLHMACNSTVLIFQAIDPRWLDLLYWLYLPIS